MEKRVPGAGFEVGFELLRQRLVFKHQVGFELPGREACGVGAAGVVVRVQALLEVGGIADVDALGCLQTSKDVDGIDGAALLRAY